MRSQLKKSFGNGFFLTEPELRKLLEKMTQQIEKITQDFTTTFELSFANELVAERPSLDAVLAEENGGVWAIKVLKVVLTDKKESKEASQVSLTFSANEKDDPISYSILGDDQEWVYNTGMVLEERLNRVKKTAFSKLVGSSSSALSLSFGGVTGHVLAVVTENSVNYMAKLLRNFDYNFYWGDYIKVYDKRQAVIKFIMFGIVLALLIGIISSIIAALILLKLGVGQGTSK